MNPALSPALLPSAAKAVGRGPPTGGQVMLEECRPERGACAMYRGRGRTRPLCGAWAVRRSRLRPPANGRALFQGPYHTSGALTRSPGEADKNTSFSLRGRRARRAPQRAPGPISQS